MVKITGYGNSVIGGREKNQDSFLLDNATHLYAVADGIGGGYEGEVASRMAIEGMQLAPPGGLLGTHVKGLQAQVLKFAKEKYGEPLVGTTLTAVRFEEGQCRLCHVGDSRCFLYDGQHLRQLTHDHEAYDENAQSTVLISYLGLDTTAFPFELQEETFTVVPGNRLLLCSDGLYKQMTEPRIIALMNEHKANPQKMLELMCQEAATVEHSDNVTVIYVEIE